VVPCHCKALNTLRGPGANDYARQHLDVVRETGGERRVLRCPDTSIMFVLEAVGGAYGPDRQLLLRRTDD
jgi:hypothetical protein